MEDEAFAEILAAVTTHRSLVSITYSNNEFGRHSLRRLEAILQPRGSGIFLEELQLINLGNISKSLIRGKKEQDDSLREATPKPRPDELKGLLPCVLRAYSLKKLKLSKMDLREKGIVRLICEVLDTLRSL